MSTPSRKPQIPSGSDVYDDVARKLHEGGKRLFERPLALRVLCGELEDMSAFKDDVKIEEVRSRLEPAVEESELHEKNLLASLRAMETDQLVSWNIEVMRDFCTEGLQKAKRALEAGKTDLAVKIIDSALDFHPMCAESWPGWPDEPAERLRTEE